MSKKFVNIGMQLYDYAVQNSETFRQDVSHVLRAAVIPRLEQILSEQGTSENTYQGRKFVEAYSRTVLGDVTQELQKKFLEIPTETVIEQDGTQVNSSGNIPDYLLEETIDKLSGTSLISQVLQEREKQVGIYQALISLSQDATRYFKPKIHSLSMKDGANLNDVFPSNLEDLNIYAVPFNRGELYTQSNFILQERLGLFLDNIYNKLLFEWGIKAGMSEYFKHAFYLIDEPTQKKGVKGRNLEFEHFLPIDVFIFHLVTTYLSRSEFDIISESDISKVESDLSEERDLDSYATIIAEEIQTRIVPFIQQISEKKPFLEWFKGKLTKKAILNILNILKNASRNRVDSSMLNPFWIARIDRLVKLKKVYLMDYVSEF